MTHHVGLLRDFGAMQHGRCTARVRLLAGRHRDSRRLHHYACHAHTDVDDPQRTLVALPCALQLLSKASEA
jgi:hypothetical protein